MCHLYKVLLLYCHVSSGTTTRPVVTPPRPLVPSPCSPKQFPCVSGECVHLDRRCDLQKDCVDWSDEKDCGTSYFHLEIGDETRQENIHIFYYIFFPLLSSSGLHHVPVDSLECMQCFLWSGLLVSAEGHTEGSSAWRGLRRSPVRQSSLLPSSMSRSVL